MFFVNFNTIKVIYKKYTRRKRNWLHNEVLMANDREVLRDIWDGKLPVCFVLNNEEICDLQTPDSYYLMVPRLSYFPLVWDKVSWHRSQSVIFIVIRFHFHSNFPNEGAKTFHKVRSLGLFGNGNVVRLQRHPSKMVISDNNFKLWIECQTECTVYFQALPHWSFIWSIRLRYTVTVDVNRSFRKISWKRNSAL